jgi:L-glyceraldehyde 3-phosphate reductase
MAFGDPYVADAGRYEAMTYKRVGVSGLQLPVVSLGLWHNFGDDRAIGTQRRIIWRAFDRGVTHFDLASNYGPPPGSAESNFGRILTEDLGPYRDELIISTKDGFDMWPGPYGEWGSRKYLLASLDQSLRRMGLEYVDIFYSHRPDPQTPFEETTGALDTAVRQGKALYVGISNYTASRLLGPSRSCGSSAPRCSSINPGTRCSTGGSKRNCWMCWVRRESVASCTRHWPKGY